jgi:ABC-type iron transport system FetAB ATPase subunit
MKAMLSNISLPTGALVAFMGGLVAGSMTLQSVLSKVDYNASRIEANAAEISGVSRQVGNLERSMSANQAILLRVEQLLSEMRQERKR